MTTTNSSLATVVAALVALDLSVIVDVKLDDNGNVDWTETEPLLKKQVFDKVEASRQVRADAIEILNDKYDQFVDEGALVGKLLSRRESRERKSRLALDSTYDSEDVFTLDESTAIRRGIESFIDSNKTREDDGKLVVGLFTSRKGRGGGIQTTENAAYIKQLSDAKKNKLS